jgi:hypothetical protein
MLRAFFPTEIQGSGRSVEQIWPIACRALVRAAGEPFKALKQLF